MPRRGDGSTLTRMEPRENRYAIPLGTLLAGAYVALPDQVEVHDVTAPPPLAGGYGVPIAGGGGDGDGE